MLKFVCNIQNICLQYSYFTEKLALHIYMTKFLKIKFDLPRYNFIMSKVFIKLIRCQRLIDDIFTYININIRNIINELKKFLFRR